MENRQGFASFEGVQTGILSELYKESKLSVRLQNFGVTEEIKENFLGSLRRNASLFEFLDFDYSQTSVNESSEVFYKKYVRCFVSCPKEDMDEERRLLCEDVFPKIRRECLRKGVHLAECDFGWNVSTETAYDRFRVAHRILEIRQNVTTYFIGVIGDRLGKSFHVENTAVHSNDLKLDLDQEMFVDLQETEFDEAGPDTRGERTLFYYFRDPEYLTKIQDPAKLKSSLCESMREKERLSRFKYKLRNSNGVMVREDYKTPLEFAELVYGDLMAQIEKDYSLASEEKYQQDVDTHMIDEFEDSVIHLFEGRENEMSELDARVLGLQTFKQPTVVVGTEGCGKSAFLVAWSRRFQSTNSLDFFFRHYCSLNNETRQWPSMIRRELGYGLHLSRTERVSGLLQEVRRRFGLRKKVPDNHELLPGAFAMWINILSSISARAVVMIDGVENLRPVFMEDKPEDSKIVNAKAKGRDELDLDMWMPRQVPNAVRIVLSSTSQSDATTKLVARKWNIYELRSLDLDEKHAILDRWMRAKDISMPERLQEKLTERTSTSNALFFTSVLRSIQTSHDLRPSGSYGSFYNLRSIHELNSALLRRLEEASEVAGMSEEILTAVSLSRRGLSEYEMLRLLQVPRALFSSFYLNARSIFKVLGGLISFDNSSLEDAVRRRYLQHPQSVKSSRLRLAASFLTRELSFRTVEEVPWQLFQCKRWQDLSNQIMNPTFFLKLAEHPKGMADLVFYWRFLGSDEGGAINIIDRCEDCVRQASDLELDLTPRIALVKSVAELLHRMNYYDIALSFHRRVREMEDHELGLTFLSHVQHMLTEARLVADKGDFRGSKLIFWRAVEMLREEVDQDNDGNITYQELKSSSAGTLFLDTEEEFVYVLWEAGAYSDLEEICLKMLKREEDRPTNELLLFDSLVHVYLERGKNDTAFSFMHTCVKEVPFRCRDEYMHVLSRLLGFLSISERHVEIVKLVESDAQLTSEICEADPSKLRMDAVDAAALYALALSRGGRAEEALDMLKTCLLKVNPLPDEDEDDGDESESSSESSVVYEGDEEEAEEAGEEVRLADCLVSGAMMFELASLIHRQLFEFEIAQDLLQRSIFIKKIEFGTRDPCVAFSVGELASLYESVRNKEMALRMRAIACAIMSGSQGHKSLLYYRALLAQAVSFWKFGSHEAALTVVTSIISNVENQFGSSHELLLQANNLHAFVLLATGDLRQAEERIDRNIRLCRALRSESHPDTLLAENCLGQLLELRGDFELAELKYKEVMEKRRQHMGMFHEYLFQDVTCLVLLYSRLGALAEAEELVRDNLPCINAFYAPESLPLAAMFDLLSVTQLARDVKSHQALDPRTSATRSLRARRKLQGKDSDHFLLFAALHGLLLLHSDHVKMACQLLQLASDLAQGSRFISSALKSIIHEQLSLSMARVRKQDPTFSLSQQKKPWESENAVSSNDSRGGGTSDYFLSLVHGQKSRRGYQDVIQQVDEVASSKTSARGQEEVGLEQRVSRGGWRPLSANAVKSDRWTSLVRKRPNTAHVTRQRRDAIDVTRATTEGGAIG